MDQVTMIRLMLLFVALGAVFSARAATLYKCVGMDGVPTYTATERAGEQCSVVSSYHPASAGPVIAAGPPTILRVCRDAPSPYAASASLRSKECTRVRCGEAGYRQKIRAYALSQPQTPEDAEDALACLARQDRDRKDAAR